MALGAHTLYMLHVVLYCMSGAIVRALWAVGSYHPSMIPQAIRVPKFHTARGCGRDQPMSF